MLKSHANKVVELTPDLMTGRSFPKVSFFAPFKRLSKNVKTPEYKTNGSSGFDICSKRSCTIKPGETVIVETGLAFQLMQGTELQVRPRSGISATTPLRVILGTVDSDYRGEIGVIVQNTGKSPEKIEEGMRIAQGVIVPVLHLTLIEVEELEETKRGNNGFGSTGTE